MTSTPGGVSTQVISAGDCTSVTAMIAAVELRKDPTVQCDFKPLLNQSVPSLCANQKNAPVIYEEDFEDGLAGWTLTNAGVFPAGWEPATDWVATSALPPGHGGSAAYAVDRMLPQEIYVGLRRELDLGAAEADAVMRSVALEAIACGAPVCTWLFA